MRCRWQKLLLLTGISFLSACNSDQQPDRLEQIQQKGELVVLTRNAATAFYESREGFVGVEFEMAKAFADYLGVVARFKVKDDISGLLQSINNDEGDLVAAGLTKTESRNEIYNFGPTYQMVEQKVVCRRGGKKPKQIQDLIGITLAVPADSSYEEQLQKLKAEHPELSWQTIAETDTETLLEQVWQKQVDCTIADSNIIDINRRYFPELSVRFAITKPEPLAWVLPQDASSLREKLHEWFEEFVDSGKLDDIMHRYYGYLETFDYVDTRTFLRRIRTVLPKYQNTFIEVAKKYDMSWTLLAAQSYQESHWNPRARSPTGVRGMMMLTLNTANDLNIKSRLNPSSSILGGAYYLDNLRKRLPDSVTEPDRTWMALAAYNVGMGHLRDARALAKHMNKDPDSWQDVKEVLPLLSHSKYYKYLKHGYARGWEPVRYVKSIRDYQDMLEKVMKENSL